MCLECSFYSFSNDTGCTVKLVSSDSCSSIVQYTETINRSGNGTAKGCVSGVTEGVYDIKVYDQSSPVLIRLLTGVTVLSLTTATTTSTTTTTTTTTTTITISKMSPPSTTSTIVANTSIEMQSEYSNNNNCSASKYSVASLMRYLFIY